ncbi:ABC transporter permease [Marinibactrum halimedae]|uniref:ABC transporter permease n=1 Tax=Marinibactrum halimedae TaxID=1444977 RepID=A0AA37T383_9GAMM|nr:FtsX-like permease family protein [Marinibactrum halimedae]MCD9459631.1 FtsX-like permease family protein [Marinibactrum halimedae]GLS25658.1 ABC transporter permease [Marinibactrum halimedae]
MTSPQESLSMNKQGFSWSVGPISRSLLKNPVSAILIILQVALTLSIVSNSLFIIDARIEKMNRPTGVVEDELLFVHPLYLGEKQDRLFQRDEDLAALRALPGVKSVMQINASPLGGSNNSNTICESEIESTSTCHTDASLFMGGGKVIQSYGLTLLEGREFFEEEIEDGRLMGGLKTSTLIITKALAEALFPGESAIGKVVYMSEKAQTIVGVVERLQRPGALIDDDEFEFSAILPMKPSSYAPLVVRAEAESIPELASTVKSVLEAENSGRLINHVITMKEQRKQGYGDDFAMTLILSLTIVLLVIVTALGITGLVSFSVGSRTKQIGIRRALGARKVDVLCHFLLENGLIVIVGIILGFALSYVLNQQLMTFYELSKLEGVFVLASALLVLMIAQLATFFPALKASRISPAIATRTV